MIARSYGAAFHGMDPLIVTVEADLQRGLPKFDIVGLAETAVREGRNRIVSALLAAGVRWKAKRVTVNLAPASVRKEGAALDLPIALGLLAALGEIPAERLERRVILGELSLNGELQPVRGVLAVADRVRRIGWKGVVVPLAVAHEASRISGVEVWGCTNLKELLAFLRDASPLPRWEELGSPAEPIPWEMDWSDVGGQWAAKRAMEISAAGHHNILLSGPPGVGKSLLARRLPTILPLLGENDSLEVSRIRSVAGLRDDLRVSARPPFRAPHHSMSLAGAIGGGKPFRPGEFTLAHRGVLFLDELPEFRRDVVEALREPLEGGEISVARAEGLFEVPARFIFAGSMNLCPCGASGDPTRDCLCPPPVVARYRRKVSGPIQDRIDLHLTLPRPTFNEVYERGRSETSRSVSERVKAACERQMKRNGTALPWNGQLRSTRIAELAPLDAAGRRFLSTALERMHLSARAIHKTIAVALSIADLAGEERITVPHLAEALTYRPPPLPDF